MHDRCIQRYLKFRGLCLSPCVLGKRNLSNGQFMIQGQFQIHFHSSLINNFKNIEKKYETSQYESSHSAWYETEHQFSFEVFDNFGKVYVSFEDLAVRIMHVDPDRLLFMFDERILIFLKSDSFYLRSVKTPKMAANPLNRPKFGVIPPKFPRFDRPSSVTVGHCVSW